MQQRSTRPVASTSPPLATTQRYHSTLPCLVGTCFKESLEEASKHYPGIYQQVLQMAYVSRLGREGLQDRVELCIEFCRKFSVVSMAGALPLVCDESAMRGKTDATLSECEELCDPSLKTGQDVAFRHRPILGQPSFDYLDHMANSTNRQLGRYRLTNSSWRFNLTYACICYARSDPNHLKRVEGSPLIPSTL